MTAPRLTLLSARAFERDLRMRLPFRFGVITLREATQVYLRVRVRDAETGLEADGHAAELMVPKWFDKSPDLSEAENVDQLRRSVHSTINLSLSAEEPATAADHAWRLDAMQRQALADENGLVAGFGPALMARAVLDALARLKQVSFYQAIQRNLQGLTAWHLPADLGGFALDDFLACLQPGSSIALRHTVGLADALSADDIGQRIDDGLPESLSEVIDVYQPDYFKLKVSGNPDTDLARLTAIAALLERRPGYRITLDGNEQFESPERFADLLDAIEATPALQRLRQALLFVEQPLPRSLALDCPVHELARRVPLLIDESDSELDSYRRAGELGYQGVSSKNCKGLYRSLLNLARTRHWPGQGWFLSAEDLTTQAGLSVQQDLALVSLLGLGHVERNGHHYVNGMSGAMEPEMDAFARAHPSLYRRDDSGLHLRINAGRIALDSLEGTGFASGATPAYDALRAMT
ncbi:MAG: hypothetical protein WED11_09695 [Natronospirillum sp.]